MKKVALELGPFVSKVIIAILMICGSMIIVTPRTASVAYEIGAMNFSPDIPKIPFCIGFFVIVFLFCVNRSNTMDYVGKILTPLLLLSMLVIVLKGIFFPVGEPIDLGISNVFRNSFVGGYQTLDAIGGITFSGAIMLAIEDNGYKDKKIQKSFALKCAIVAGLGLLIIYGGLCYIGATASGIFQQGIDNTTLLIEIIQLMMGQTGLHILAVVVLLACLTTAIGAVAGFGSFFERISKGKIPYKVGVSAICVVGILISTLSVNQIISMATPILLIIYSELQKRRLTV